MCGRKKPSGRKKGGKRIQNGEASQGYEKKRINISLKI